MISHPLVGKISSIAYQFPDSPALIENDGSSLTYRELQVRVSEIVESLQLAGVCPGQRVALLQNKSCLHIATLLAVAECRAIIVPIDPQAPLHRIEYLLGDLQPHFLIAESKRVPASVIESAKQNSHFTDSYSLLQFHTSAIANSDLAYILYTSGSTGMPKGVCISHEALDAFVNWSTTTVPLSNSDRVASIASTHFDLSLYDIFVALSCGAALYLFDSEIVKNARMMTKMLSENKITSIYATPSFLSAIVLYGKIEKYQWTVMRQVLFAGEVFATKHLHALMGTWREARYYNLYGPTETNVCVWYEVVTKENERTAPYPIGKICEGLHFQVDASGELLIGGKHVASGYLNSAELTEDKFFTLEGIRWFKTGDKVTQDNQGNLVYAGRIDRMIKRRGYRIEPIEIENALLHHSVIRESAVTTFANEEGEIQIAAFIVMQKDKSESAASLKTFLLKYLPDYMVPDRIIEMSEFPKTSSGKTDYKMLREKISPDI